MILTQVSHLLNLLISGRKRELMGVSGSYRTLPLPFEMMFQRYICPLTPQARSLLTPVYY